MRVLVTGGTGYLGRAVVRALAARGHDVVVFARGATASQLPGQPVDGDVRDFDAVDAAVQGCHAICHMAALVSVWRRRPRDFDETNVNGLRHVLTAARRAGIRKVLYTSSFLALPPTGERHALAVNDYQRTKVAAEQVAIASERAGVPIIRLYPGVLYGPGAFTEANLVGRLLRDHMRGRLPGLIGAERLWSFTYVDDVARAYVETVERGRIGQHYLLCGENAPQMRAFEIVRQLTGRKLPRRIPYAVADVIGAAEEFRARMTGRLPLLTRGTVEIFRHDWAYDSADAVRDLGYEITPLTDGVARTLASLSS
jgi:farnesol dehydrogenase